ncbi:MAG: hypothetical protein COT19_02780 [Gallionellales bacterium CG08_land_8_20_14_0_20_59_87]|nr:MAG: hypothetical protein COT19_02780 [Gallionellales bacterium CG08_land_8_20_14_0_20_59_87]
MMNKPETSEDLEQELPPSKTKVKKQMHDLRDLGKQLTELPKDKWRALGLPENLLEALAEYKRITKFGAQKRQLQYIGKLMREVETAPILAKLDAWNGTSREHTAWLHQVEQWRDRLLEDGAEYKRITKFGAQKRQLQYIGKLMREVETAPILAKLDAWNGTSREHTAWLHQVEQWRDRLLEDGDALTELLANYPLADAQRLRALIRNALKEKELEKPPKSYREIFQLLREIIPAP